MISGKSSCAYCQDVLHHWLLAELWPMMCWNFKINSFIANWYNFFQKNLSEALSECQMVWIKIRTDIHSILIWTQTVCNGYQQTAKDCKKLLLTQQNQFYFNNKNKINKQTVGPVLSCSWFKLFAKVISRRRKKLLTRKVNVQETLLLPLSQCMRFPTIWYVRPAKPQISLRIRAV